MADSQQSGATRKDAAIDAMERLRETRGIWMSLKPKSKDSITALSLAINEQQKEVRSIMGVPVSKLCPACKKSCCAYSPYCYLNMTDEIQYFALGREGQLERAIMDSIQSAGDTVDGGKTQCLLFKYNHGCSLPDDLRPWTCVRFICDEMWLELALKKPEIKNLLASISKKRREVQRIMKNRPRASAKC